tara:strand:+ start:664 stop:1629 length:966 start_codon:yes stop_codon:yes gene_type:complete
MISEEWQAEIWIFLDNLLNSALFVFSPGQRLFWVSCLTSMLIALLVLRFQGRPLNRKFLRRVFLSKRYWLNASARADLRWLGINCLTKGLLATLFVSAKLVFTMAVAYAIQSNLGTAALQEIPWLLVTLIFTLTLFVTEDLSRFILHIMMHRVPFFWRFHKIHHSATTLTPLTLHRVHPFETCLYFAREVFVFGLVSGVFVYFFGGKLTALDILGVQAFGFLFNLMGANLRHSHIWMSFGRLELIFISPAQHQIHHSNLSEHANSNYGTCLAIWDYCFGSWIAAGMRPKNLRFGLGNADPAFTQNAAGMLSIKSNQLAASA